MCFKVMCNICRCIKNTEDCVEEFLYQLCLLFNFEDQNFEDHGCLSEIPALETRDRTLWRSWLSRHSIAMSSGLPHWKRRMDNGKWTLTSTSGHKCLGTTHTCTWQKTAPLHPSTYTKQRKRKVTEKTSSCKLFFLQPTVASHWLCP